MNKSSELILRALANGNTTQKQLILATALAPRTIRYAISRLKDYDILEEIISFDDLRTKNYKINEKRRHLCPGYYLNMRI